MIQIFPFCCVLHMLNQPPFCNLSWELLPELPGFVWLSQALQSLTKIWGTVLRVCVMLDWSLPLHCSSGPAEEQLVHLCRAFLHCTLECRLLLRVHTGNALALLKYSEWRDSAVQHFPSFTRSLYQYLSIKVCK